MCGVEVDRTDPGRENRGLDADAQALTTPAACMLYVLDPYKGLCFISKKNQEYRIVHSAGLDQFDWDLVLPDIEVPILNAENNGADNAALAADQPKKKGKEARKEKRELKKQAKVSQKAAAIHSKLTRSGISSSSLSENDDFNPYVAKKQISNLHALISKVAKAEEDTKLFKIALVDMYKSDVQYLLPGEWLNDNNISFMYEAIITYFLKEHGFGFQIQLLFPALIQLFLHYPVEADLQGILPMKDLAKLKLVFLPFNFMDSDDYVDLEGANNGDHWALCVLSIPERKLYVYDSMAFDGDDDDRLLLQLALRLQKALFKPSEKLHIVKMKCDQQENFDDCGVFLIMYSCHLLSHLLSGDPTDLSLAHVKFNPVKARLKMLEIVYMLSLEARNEQSASPASN